MKRRLKMKKLKKFISSSAWPLWIVFIVAQVILSFFLYNQAGLQTLRHGGWITSAVSVVFGFMPILTFRRKGRVSKGKSYVDTTVLVDNGIYAVVRHPQYLSFILLSLALLLLAQHWLITCIGIVAMALVYIGILPDADQDGIKRFGDDYKRYMQRVPRVNFVTGIIRLVRRSERG
jgi:protein-S-isoprenylcysteine O-methyltransferase Ste14